MEKEILQKTVPGIIVLIVIFLGILITNIIYSIIESKKRPINKPETVEYNKKLKFFRSYLAICGASLIMGIGLFYEFGWTSNNIAAWLLSLFSSRYLGKAVDFAIENPEYNINLKSFYYVFKWW